MEYHGAPSEFIEDALQLASASKTNTKVAPSLDSIFTIEHLNLNVESEPIYQELVGEMITMQTNQHKWEKIQGGFNIYQ